MPPPCAYTTSGRGQGRCLTPARKRRAGARRRPGPARRAGHAGRSARAARPRQARPGSLRPPLPRSSLARLACAVTLPVASRRRSCRRLAAAQKAIAHSARILPAARVPIRGAGWPPAWACCRGFKACSGWASATRCRRCRIARLLRGQQLSHVVLGQHGLLERAQMRRVADLHEPCTRRGCGNARRRSRLHAPAARRQGLAPAARSLRRWHQAVPPADFRNSAPWPSARRRLPGIGGVSSSSRATGGTRHAGCWRGRDAGVGVGVYFPSIERPWMESLRAPFPKTRLSA